MVKCLTCILLVKEVSSTFAKGHEWTAVQTPLLHHVFVVTVANKPSSDAYCIVCYFLGSCKIKMATSSEMQ